MDKSGDESAGTGDAQIPVALIQILADMVAAAMARVPLDAEQIREERKNMAAIHARFGVPALVTRNETDDPI